MTVREIFQTIEERFIDTTEERQEELRAVARKIKLTRNRNVSGYVNKHRILRQDMNAAGCSEIEKDNEKTTIRHIITGLEDKEAWDQFRTSWKLIPNAVRPSTIDELERLMTEHAREIKNTNEWQRDNRSRWQFKRDTNGR